MYSRDRYLIPLAVPVLVCTVIALNNDPLPQLIREIWFWRDFAAGSLLTGFVWFSIRSASLFLDKDHPWKNGFARRLSMQALLGWALPSVLLFGLCWLLFETVIGQPFFESYFPYYEFPFCVLLLALINVYYMVSALLNKEENVSGNPSVFFAYKGPDRYPLRAEMIRLIVKNDSALDIYTADGLKLQLSATVDSMEKALPSDSFFRVNRQTIVHISAIRSFRPAENGKIEVHTGLEYVENPVVSQKKAAEFRKWIAKASLS